MNEKNEKAKMSAKKILLVEDDTFLREILHEKLVHAGYDVTPLRESEHVLDATVKATPDIILLDIMMPKKNGYEVIDELKADERTKGIPIIVLSNLSQDEDIEKAKAAGALDFLTKANFMPEEIVVKIESTLAASSSSGT